MLDRLKALPRDARDTLFLLVVVAWVVLPQVGNLPWWCSLLTGVVLTWRGFLAFGSRPLPGKWWLLMLLAGTIAATLVTHRTVLGREAGVTMVVVLLALKTLELRARRDALVIFFLGFFAMLTNFFYSQSLVTAFCMLVALLGLLTALVNAHMPVGRPPLLEAAKTAAWMALLGAPIMAALFLLFPRLAPLWGVPADAMTGRSGLSANMQVGAIASLALDDSIAMRVKFEGTPPPQQTLYFRGPVLAGFDGREWTAASNSPYWSRMPVAAELRVTGAPVAYDVTLEPNNRPWLFTLEMSPEGPQAAGMPTIRTQDLQWLGARMVTDLVRYRVQSYTDFSFGPTGFVPGLQAFLELPAGSNPRTVALAQQMLADGNFAGRKPAMVEAAMQRLRTGGYTYTLEPGVYGQNTADEFWFDRKEGFCEHIASSFVILMRALGIPARIVTGYQGGERNAVDGFWVVRQSDAHAWAEVWLAGQGWVRIDPTTMVAPGRTGSLQRLTPPRGVLANAMGAVNPNLAASLRAAWEAVNNSWNQWVLNYTQSKQLDLLKGLGFEAPSWADLSYVLIVLIVVVATAGAGIAWWDRSQHDPWLRLLQRVRRQLARRGLEVPAASGPRQIAALVTDRFGEGAKMLSDWLLRLEAQRYARQGQTSLAALQREYRQMAWPQ